MDWRRPLHKRGQTHARGGEQRRAVLRARARIGRARLELGDGADKGLLGALEQLREPALQAVVALRGRGEESEGSKRLGATPGKRYEARRNEPLQAVAHPCGGCQMDFGRIWRRAGEPRAESRDSIEDRRQLRTTCSGRWRRRAWMRRAQSLASSGSSQRRWSKSHVPAELRSWHQQWSHSNEMACDMLRSPVPVRDVAVVAVHHTMGLDSGCAHTHLTMHCIRTRTRQNPRDSRCLFSSGSEIPFLLGWC